MISDLAQAGLPHQPVAVAVFHQQERALPGSREQGLLRQERRRRAARRRWHPRFQQSRRRRQWYEGLLTGLLEAGRRRDQGRLRRGRAARRRVRVRPHRLVRAQSLSAALQQDRRRSHGENHRRAHHLGPQRLGRQPALSACTGAATPRTPIPRWPPRCAPACRSASRGFTYWSHDAGGFVGKAPRDLYRRWLPFCGPLVAHPLPRRPAARAVGIRRGVHRRLPPHDGAALPADAVHLRPGQAQLGARLPDDAGAVLRVPRRSDLLAHRRRVHVRLRPAGRAALRERRRSATSTSRRATGSTIKPGRATKAASGTRLSAGAVPIVLLVRSGAVVPLADVAQSTAEIKWDDSSFACSARTAAQPPAASPSPMATFTN